MIENEHLIIKIAFPKKSIHVLDESVQFGV